MTEALRQACARALHVITEDGQTLRAGSAALFVLERTTPRWRRFARVLSHRPLLWGVEAGYWLVARNRRRIAPLILPKR